MDDEESSRGSDDEGWIEKYAAAAVNEMSIVPDSEPDENASEDDARLNKTKFPPPDFSQAGSDDENARSARRRMEIKDMSRVDTPEDEEHGLNVPMDEDSGDGMYERREGEKKGTFPPRKSTYIEPTADANDDEVLVIDSELQQTYLKMVREGASEEKWNEFCERERQELIKNDDQWAQWTTSQEESDLRCVGENEEDPGILPPAAQDILESNLPEPSETLATIASMKPPSRSRPRGKGSMSEETTTVVRRSQRVRKESRKARESEDWQAMKRRTYEREEKLTRQAAYAQNKTVPTSVYASFGARLSIFQPNPSKPPERSNLPDEAAPVLITGPVSYRQKEPTNEDQFQLRNNKLAKEIAAIKKNGSKTNLDEQWHCGQRDVEEPMDVLDEIWRVLPNRDGSRNESVFAGIEEWKESGKLPWISKRELNVIMKWLGDLPRSAAKCFYAYAIEGEGIAVSLVPEKGVQKDPYRRLQVLEMWRSGGALIGIPAHTIGCAEASLEDPNYGCACEQDRPPLITAFRIPPDRTIRPPLPPYEGPSRSMPMDIPKKVAACRVAPQPDDTSLSKDPGEDISNNEETTIINEDLPGDTTDTSNNDKTGHPEARETPDERDEIADESSIIDDWEEEQGKFDEKTYQIGKSTYRSRDLSRPVKNRSPDERIYPFKEFSGGGKLLQANGGYNPNIDYPIVTEDEIKQIVIWCDNLPEYQNGGRRFRLHSTKRGTVALTEVGAVSDPNKSNKRKTPVLELERIATGELREVAGSIVESRGKFSFMCRANQEATIIEEPPLNENMVPGTTDNDNYLTNRSDDDRDNALASLATIQAQHGQSGESLHQMDLEEKRKRDDEEEDIPETPTPAHTNSTQSPFPTETLPNLDSELDRQIKERFPSKGIMYCIPLLENPSPGLLAARKIVPILEYEPKEDDYEFYAEGVTLVLDEDEQRTTYYRGNALIRLSGRNWQGIPKPPSRGRTEFMRRRLFRMDQNKDQKKNEEQQDLHDEEPGPSRSKENRDRETARPCGIAIREDGERIEMAKEELEAMMKELMENPLEEEDEQRAYRIQKTQNGVIEVARITTDHPAMKCLSLRKDEGRVSKGKRKEDDGRTSDREPTSQLGSDPQAPDRDLEKIGQNPETEIPEIWYTPLSELTELVPTDTAEEIETLDAGKRDFASPGTIKTNESAHQEDSSPPPISTPQNLNSNLETSETLPCSQPMTQKPPPSPNLRPL